MLLGAVELGVGARTLLEAFLSHASLMPFWGIWASGRIIISFLNLSGQPGLLLCKSTPNLLTHRQPRMGMKMTDVASGERCR